MQEEAALFQPQAISAPQQLAGLRAVHHQAQRLLRALRSVPAQLLRRQLRVDQQRAGREQRTPNAGQQLECGQGGQQHCAWARQVLHGVLQGEQEG